MKSEQAKRIAQMILDNVMQWTRGGGNYAKLQSEIETVVDAVLQEWQPVCEWVCDEDGMYHTECGDTWHYPESTREENGQLYCHKCGRAITEKARQG